MKLSSSSLIALLTLTAALVPACGSNGSGGQCPNVAGQWTIQSHCQTALQGSPVAVTQNGCSFTANWGGTTPFTGVLSENGASTMTGVTGGTTLTCTGSVTGNTWTNDCNPGGCHVVCVR